MGDQGDVTAELVRDPGKLAAVADRWRELAVARENAFVTPEWFESWMRRYGDVEQPLVVLVRDASGALIGLLPLVEPAGRFRLPRFAGSGFSDHLQPVAPPELDDVVGSAAGAALRASGRRPELLLENVDAGSSWWSALSRSSGSGSKPLVGRPSVLPRVLLEGRSYDEYLASRSRNMRSQLRRRRRVLERDHGAAFRWTATRADLDADLATLFRLHDLRWATRSDSSGLSSPRARGFIADFAARALEQGWLRLCILEAEAEPVAAWLGWRLGGRFVYYQAGFDPEWSQRSVGLVLLAESVRAAAAEGAREYDMLLGDEDFKGRFADSQRHVCTALVAPRLRPARLLAASEIGLRRVAYRLPDGVRGQAKQRFRSALERLPLARGR